MVDNLSKEKRSKVMSSIKGKNTKPELIIRKMLWSKGKRYRIHDRTVFGTPDISNKTKKIAVFIDGCFWHGCPRCYRQPKTNTNFWTDKITNNKKRRRIVKANLRKEGWKILEIWEHEITKDSKGITKEIMTRFR